MGHILCVLSLVSGHCPPPESLTPCECIIDIRDHLSLICDGNQIKDLKSILNDNLKVDSENNLLIFKTLLINDTSITAIESETFGDAIFEKILIKNNLNLTNINPKAFQNTIETNFSQFIIAFSFIILIIIFLYIIDKCMISFILIIV